MDKKGFGALAQLAIVLFGILLVITFVPAIRTTLISVLSIFG